MQRKDGFVIRIKIKDETGKVVGETDAVTFKGLLSLAHDEQLRSVRTRLIQAPTDGNGKVAIVFATVRTRRGVFTGVGDASPANVNRRIVPHIIRMAETRSVARALRLAVNIGDVAIEELADDASVVDAPLPRGDRREVPAQPTEATRGDGDARRPERFRGRDNRPTDADPGDRRAMSEEQRKLCFRLAFALGETRDSAGDRVLKALGVERFESATRIHASQAIDALKRELSAQGGNGHSEKGEVRHGA